MCKEGVTSIVYVENVKKKREGVRVTMKSAANPREKPKEFFVETNDKIPPAKIFSVSNPTSEPVIIALKVRKLM